MVSGASRHPGAFPRGAGMTGTRWTRDGRTITVEEDEPGIVKIETAALSGLLATAGFRQVEEPERPVGVWPQPAETRPGIADGTETR
jgi:hypothetical protein